MSLALATCLPALPVLSGQLREVIQQIETGVVGIGESFQGMAQRARAAVGQLGLGDESDAGAGGELNQLISTARQVMAGLLQRIEQTSQLSQTTVARMEQIEKRLDGLDEILREIDAVASNARLLALNGQIEAARAGKQGAAFAIVATETAKMAVQALKASKTIRTLTAQLSEEIVVASQQLHTQASADAQQVTQCRQEVNETLDGMAAMNARMQQTMSQARQNSQRLASDISQAIVAMQFQDSVSQRIGHVVTTLEEIHEDLKSTLDAAAAPASLCPTTVTWADRMAERYTMASERDTLATHVGGRTQDTCGLGNNVELF